MVTKGLLKAIVILASDDAVSNDWPKCTLGNDSDYCPCRPCVLWLRFLEARRAIAAILKELK